MEIYFLTFSHLSFKYISTHLLFIESNWNISLMRKELLLEAKGHWAVPMATKKPFLTKMQRVSVLILNFNPLTSHSQHEI